MVAATHRQLLTASLRQSTAWLRTPARVDSPLKDLYNRGGGLVERAHEFASGR
jgi:hypothetical protein